MMSIYYLYICNYNLQWYVKMLFKIKYKNFNYHSMYYGFSKNIYFFHWYFNIMDKLGFKYLTYYYGNN